MLKRKQWILFLTINLLLVQIIVSQTLSETFSLAENYFLQHDFEKAEKMLLRVLYFDTNNTYKARCKEFLADIKCEQNLFDEAELLLQESLAMCNNKEQIIQLKKKIITTQILAGHYSEAERMIQELRSDNPKDTLTTNVFRGILLFQQNNFPEAKKYFLRSIPDSCMAIRQEIEALFSNKLVKQRPSPLKASILSAIVPGSGQVYSGKIWDGINSASLIGFFGLANHKHFFEIFIPRWHYFCISLVL
jgi:predicted Zn-dependent protease